MVDNVGPRQATLVALLFLFFGHYALTLLTGERGGAGHKNFSRFTRYIYLYGVAAVLSATFIQGGTFHAVLAWLTLVATFVIYGLIYRESAGRVIGFASLGYFSLIAIWYSGLMIDFLRNYPTS